jgi:hypothetical protein
MWAKARAVRVSASCKCPQPCTVRGRQVSTPPFEDVKIGAADRRLGDPHDRVAWHLDDGPRAVFQVLEAWAFVDACLHEGWSWLADIGVDARLASTAASHGEASTAASVRLCGSAHWRCTGEGECARPGRPSLPHQSDANHIEVAIRFDGVRVVRR